ncbi:MAG: aminoglycoside phosphotransferase family protein [Armatimonas sp.]
MMSEDPDESLGYYPQRPIFRRGNAIHRPAHYWTPAVHDLLNYLKSVDFPYSPRVLGFDSEGREMLAFLPGESGSAGWHKIISDEGLEKYARLLRRYHDVVKNYRPGEDSQWAHGTGGVAAGELVCHGDFGPWNIVWQGSEPVGILDWDIATPALPERDILYALEYSAPFRDEETTLKWHHFPELPDRKRRIEVFCQAYGVPVPENVTRRVAALQRQVAQTMVAMAARGVQPQKDWVANGALEDTEKQARWTESHQRLFEPA